MPRKSPSSNTADNSAGKTAGKSAEKSGDPVPGRTASEPEEVNEVRLVGRVAAEPALLEMPSGDTLCSVRVVVSRPLAAVRGTAKVDALECSTFNGRLRRSVSSWAPGDVVEVSGALRRRFFRTGGGVASRIEVELASGRLIRRAASG